MRKAKDLDKLLYLIKEKLNDRELKKSRKIQILTMVPESWSIKKVVSFFNVSDHMIRAARKLTKEKGILELPAAKKGKTLSEEVTQSVLAFYEDDEYTRLMPGKRDCVSLGKKEYRQKRLLIR